MKKVLWCRFEQFLTPFTMLLVEMTSEKRLFRHLSNHVLGVRNFGNTKSMTVIFFFNMFKIYSRFQKCKKQFRKSFFFSDNCFWIGIFKLTLLRTGYLSLAASVLPSSPKIWHVKKGDSFQLNCLGSDQ